MGSRVVSTVTKLAAYTPVDPLPVGDYSWRLRKLDADGNPGPWSTTLATFAVTQQHPDLLAPDDAAGFAANDLLFSWSAVPGAASYRFESSTSTSFGTLLERPTTVMTSWAPTAYHLDGSGTSGGYSVLDGAGNVTATSPVRAFIKDSAAPRVTAATPTAGLAVDGTVTATFNEPVRGLSTSGLVLTVAGTATRSPGRWLRPRMWPPPRPRSGRWSRLSRASTTTCPWAPASPT